MSCLHVLETHSFVAHADPRVRVVAGFGLAMLLAVSQQSSTLLTGLALALAFCIAARLPMAPMRRRMIRLNVFMAFLFPFLALRATPVETRWLPVLILSSEGAQVALQIIIKGNAIVLVMSGLISTLDTPVLGHALAHLRVPNKLIHLFLFTVRYVEVLHMEHLRITRGIRARGFRARANSHTYRTLSSLAGMLLVRSFDRSERVLAAMKCRGFRGSFFLFDHFHAGYRDVVFGSVAVAVVLLLAWIEWV